MQSTPRVLILGCAILWAFSAAGAQATRPATAPTATAGDDDIQQLLGEGFTSLAAGISFRPPVGGVESRPAAMGTRIVQYANAQENWTLIVSRVILDKPLPLVAVDDPKTPADESLTRPSMMAETLQQLKKNFSGAQILRQDRINVGRSDTGLIILRSTQGTLTSLRQEALLMKNDQVYYVFDFSTPSSWTPGDPKDSEDPAERIAVQIFNGILDSIRLLDQKPIQDDLKDRIYCTMAWAINLPRRVEEALSPEQYFRVIHGGRDVGWSYVTESVGDRRGKNGVFVAGVSQEVPETGTQIDLANEMFCSLDRKDTDEAWIAITVVTKNGAKNHAEEYGGSEKRIRRVFVEKENDLSPRKGPPDVKVVPQYNLNVTQTSYAGAKQIARELPEEYYLPQAFNSMLPRLLPIREPKGYVFLRWVGSERELIYRYVDVEAEQDVKLDGKTVRAVPIRDRIGLEGAPTFHYISIEGKYLGNVTPSTDVTVLPTDAQTITRLWPNAQVGRPHILDTHNFPTPQPVQPAPAAKP